MQELIPKKSAIEILYKILDNDFYPDHNNCKYSPSMCADVRDVFKKFWPLLDTLSPVVHHEYKVGEVYEFYDDWEWVKWKLSWFHKESGFRYVYLNIRPLQSEHPDITQARELASKHWYSITKI